MVEFRENRKGRLWSQFERTSIKQYRVCKDNSPYAQNEDAATIIILLGWLAFTMGVTWATGPWFIVLSALILLLFTLGGFIA